MGYYNPIYVHGVEQFLDDALEAGIDGLIVVDLPPEMDDELASLPCARASTSSVWPPRPPMTGACRPF